MSASILDDVTLNKAIGADSAEVLLLPRAPPDRNRNLKFLRLCGAKFLPNNLTS